MMVAVPLQRMQVDVGGVIIGSGTDVPLKTISGLGLPELDAREYRRPIEDGIAFGQETRQGRVITFEGSIVREGDPQGAWDLKDELYEAFDGEDLRERPQQVTVMRLRRPGRPTRLVFGRPGKYDPDLEQAKVGFIPWVGTFRAADSRFYDEVENLSVLKISSTSDGGIVTTANGGLLSPLTTIAGTRRTSLISNDGDRPTWPVITIRGPVDRPALTLIDQDGAPLWRLGIAGAIADGQTAVIDTRPWSRGAALQSGSPLPAPLTVDSVPSRSALPPGTYELIVSGTDTTGTSSFETRWRNAYRQP